MSDSPKKIAFVTTMAGAPWGGSEELWCQTAMRLKTVGHRVGASVLGWPDRPAAIDQLVAQGVEMDFRPVTRGFVDRLSRKALKLIQLDAGRADGRQWLEEFSPDLVVISQGMAWEGTGWMETCLELGLRYCPIVHANSEHWWPVNEQFDAAVRGYSGAHKVCCVSKANLKMLELQLGKSLQNAEVVVNPWKGETSAPCPWPGDDGVTRLACVGRVDPKAKGQDLLLQVMAMPKWRERPLHVTIYGGGPCEKALEALSQMLKLENVSLAGHVSDVDGIWESNHGLVLPSRFEGLPLVIIEAMQKARPVITTDVAGNAEHLTEGVSGFVAEAPTVNLLDAAMERAWQRRSDWCDIGMAARETVMTNLPSDPIEVFGQQVIDWAGSGR